MAYKQKTAKRKLKEINVKVGHVYDVDVKTRTPFLGLDAGNINFKSAVKNVDTERNRVNFEDKHYLDFEDFKKGDVQKFKDLGKKKEGKIYL